MTPSSGNRPEPAMPPTMTPSVFRRISVMLREASGIHLQPGKEFMVESRLSPHLRELGIPSLSQYLDLVDKDASERELSIMVDLLTTNKTGFYREHRHFDHLVEQLRTVQGNVQERALIWSGACSTGQEPFSIAMACREAGVDRVDILATDISRRALAVARRGEYLESEIAAVPPGPRSRYFERAGADRSGRPMWRVTPSIRRQVSFAHLNLHDPWPMHGPFDAVFCRNVMMYFDWETQCRLIARMDRILKPDGHLYVGLSECLGAKAKDLHFVELAVYRTREQAA